MASASVSSNGRMAPATSRASRGAARPEEKRTPPVSISRDVLGGISWSPGFIALQYFLWAIITFRAVGSDIAAVICLGAMLTRPDHWRIPVPHLWFVVMLVWAGLGVLSTSYTDVASEKWIELGKVFLIALMVYNTVRTREQLRLTMLVCVVSFFVYPFRGAVTNYVFGYSLFGRAVWNFVYDNPNDMAAFAILFASVAMAAAALYRNRVLRLALLGCALAFVCLVFLTQSRGALVGMALAGIINFLGSKQKLRLIGGAAVLAVAAAIFAPSSLWERLGGLSNVGGEGGMRDVDKEGSALQRYEIAQVALAVGLNEPMLGVGIGAYPFAHSSQAAMMSSELPSAGGTRDAHNTYLRVFAELGVPGLLCFLALLASTGVIVVRTIRRAILPPSYVSAVRWLGLGLLAYCFSGVFGSFAYINMLYIHISLICLLAIALRSDARRRTVAGP